MPMTCEAGALIASSLESTETSHMPHQVFVLPRPWLESDVGCSLGPKAED